MVAAASLTDAGRTAACGVVMAEAAAACGHLVGVAATVAWAAVRSKAGT